MDALLEFLFTILLEPIFTLLIEAPAELAEQSLSRKKVPKWLRVILIMLLLFGLFAIIGAVIVGAVMVAKPETPAHKTAGIVLLSVGLALFVGYVTFSVVKFILVNKRDKIIKKTAVKNTEEKRLSVVGIPEIGQEVYILVDRPRGFEDYENNIVYESNFGFSPEYSNNDKYQNAYVLGIDESVTQFAGILAAIIHRYESGEDIWVVVPENYEITDAEIIARTEFLEKYYRSALIR